MDFFRRAPGRPSSVAIFSAAFNPPTVAHRALVEAALESIGQVLIALPRVFPHKAYEGPDFETRRQLVEAAFPDTGRISIAGVDGGLFIDIARECQPEYPGAKLVILLGRDAAERIVDWDYGEPGAFHRQLELFELLVASRSGSYCPPDAMKHRIHTLELPVELDPVSSSEVRRRIREGEGWHHLVPPATVPLIERAISSFSAV